MGAWKPEMWKQSHLHHDSLFPVKFKASTAGYLAKLPALNLTRNREKVNISSQNVTRFFCCHHFTMSFTCHLHIIYILFTHCL